MSEEKYLQLLEYKNYLEHFNENPFEIYKFTYKPTIEHILLLRDLEPKYYNSFYIVSILKTYFDEGKSIDDIEFIQTLSMQIFKNEAMSKDPLLELSQEEIPDILDINQRIEICEIEKLIFVLNDYDYNKYALKINYITSSILIMQCLGLKCKLLFLEAFITSQDSIILHKKLLKELIYFLGGINATEYLGDQLNEEEINFNIDYLEVCLFILNNYLEELYAHEEKDIICEQNINKTILEEQIDKIYSALVEEINFIEIGSQDFEFSKQLFDEMYSLLSSSQVLENDIFVMFKLTFSITVLSSAHNDMSFVERIMDKTMMSKEFMIREELMVDLQMKIIDCLYMIKSLPLSKHHLKLLLNSNAIAFLTKSNRSKVIACLYANEILDIKERMLIIRNAFFGLEVSLDEYKDDPKKLRECIGLLCVFLEYISYCDSSAHFVEISNYFTGFSNYEESIEYFADFLSRNNIESSLWAFLRNSSTNYIIKFYFNFFRKVRRNFEQRRLKHGDENFDYTHIIDRHVKNFCKIFLERKDVNLVNVLNTIPSLSSKPEYFKIYYQLWLFIFDHDLEDEMLFFKYKTPALVNLSFDADQDMILETNLHDKIFKLLSKEKNNEFFSHKNIVKNYTCFTYALILFIEREKIRNYIFEGIYNYIRDVELIKRGLDALIYVMISIHYSLKIKYSKMKEYFLGLLEMFNQACISTKIIILEISKLMIKNEKFLIFDLDINIKFCECINYLKLEKKSVRNQALLSDFVDTYKKKFLNNIKGKAKIIYDYILMNVCDVDYFSDFKLNASGTFAKINASVNIKIEKIRNFESENNDTYDENEKFEWLIDCAYMNRYCFVMMRRCLDLLKTQMTNNYCLDKLYVLLRIYNIIEIREEEIEFYLRKAIYISLNFNKTNDAIRKLYEETTGFFKFYFSHLFLIYNGYNTKIISSNFPTKKEYFIIFSAEDMIYIYNMFKKKFLHDYLYSKNIKKYLNYFYDINNLSLLDIVSILRTSEEREMVNAAFKALEAHDVIPYIPQFVQCLKHKQISSEVYIALHDLCENEHLCHFLIWNLRSNAEEEKDIFNKCIHDLESSYGHVEVEEESEDNTKKSHKFLQEIYFFNELTGISSQMMPYLKSSKPEKLCKINSFLAKILVPAGIYLPTDVSYEIVRIVPCSGRVLQSHAKVPFMASFFCVKQEELTEEIREDIYKIESLEVQTVKHPVVIKNLIFKAGDDCRQDMLALQIITKFREIFIENNLDLYLFPYQVIATGPDTGIIEVIPDAITRDQMGREKINDLVDYFQFKFGFQEGETYKKAVYNFTRSFAAYSLVTYFLNIKDRHNGNIMIDKHGHIIHIDFGYMFEISPGNFNIEIPIKLTREIYDLLLKNEMYDIYIDLMLKGFFLLRRNSKDIVFLVDSFKDSGLPCYKKKAVDNFINRFKFNLTDDEAKIFIVTMINSSIRRMRTWVYDKYQEITNNIAF